MYWLFDFINGRNVSINCCDLTEMLELCKILHAQKRTWKSGRPYGDLDYAKTIYGKRNGITMYNSGLCSDLNINRHGRVYEFREVFKNKYVVELI